MVLEINKRKFNALGRKSRGTGIFRNTVPMIIFSSLFFGTYLQAQINVTGEVNTPGGQPVPFANVLFLQPTDSSLVSGTITNEEGKFMLEIQPALYLFNVSMLGYDPFFSIINVEGPKLFTLSPVYLLENMHQLGEVVVQGKRPVFEKEVDRTIINVQNSITSAGKTVLEVLEKSPGVIVNRQGGSIELNGKEGVLVMINNKWNRLPMDAVVQMLEGMSAAAIDRIELITNPPARYDAEGNAGIIHIVMKENPDRGTNAGVGVSLGYNHAETLGGNISINHRSKNFSAVMNYSLHHDNNRHLSNMQRYQVSDGFIQSDIDSSIRDPFITIHNLNAGLEFLLSEKTLFHFSLTGYQRNWKTKDIGWNFFSPTNGTSLITDILKKEQNVWKSGGAGIGFNHAFNERHNINLMVDYLYYHNNNPSQFINERQIVGSSIIDNELIEIQKETPIDFRILNFDYSGKIWDQVLFETGIKGSWSEFTNEVRVTRNAEDEGIADPAFTSISSLEEKIYAAYFSLNWMLQNNWSLNGGLRYEFTDTHLGGPGIPALVDESYGNLFPNLTITRNLNENNKLNFAYKMRINRPNYNQMAPFVFFFGLNTFVAGNLSLKPALNKGAEISYQRRNWWLTLYYSNTKDEITRYQPELDTTINALVYRSQNLDYSKSYGLNTNFSFQVTSWWKMQNYFSVSRNSLRTKHLVANLQNSINSFSVNTSNTFVLNNKLSAEVTGLYQSPVMWGFSTFKSGGNVNCGIQWKMKKNALLSLVLNDVFNTNTWILETEREIFRSRWDYDSGTRSITLSFRREFGDKKFDGMKISSGSKDEQQRVQ